MTFTPRFMNVVSYLVMYGHHLISSFYCYLLSSTNSVDRPWISDSHTVDETPKLPHGKDIALVFTQLDQVNGV